jgi:chemotaxis protein CheC
MEAAEGIIVVVFSQLTNEQLEALRDVSNSGMGHAAIALSRLIGKTVHPKVSRINAMDFARVSEYLGGMQQTVVVITLKILGAARGDILLAFTRENCLKMLDRLLPRDKTDGTLLTELEVSALKEIGNILASAYLNALGERFEMTLLASVPVLSFDMARVVADYALAEPAAGDESLMIEAEFSDANDHIGGHFFLLPDPPSLDAILKKMGV